MNLSDFEGQVADIPGFDLTKLVGTISAEEIAQQLGHRMWSPDQEIRARRAIAARRLFEAHKNTPDQTIEG